MLQLNPNISAWDAAVYLLLFIFIIFIFRSLRRAANWPLLQKYFPETLKRLLPVTEAFVWFAALLKSVQAIFPDQTLQSMGILAALTVVTFWVSGYAVRDFIAGVIQLSRGAFEKGDRLRIDQTEGTVQKLGYFALSLETEKGEILSVPYSSLSRKTLVKTSRSKKLKTGTFRFRLPDGCRAEDEAEKLRIAALQAPWSAGQAPVLKIDEDEKGEFCDLTVFCIDEAFFPKIKSYIKQRVPNKPAGETEK